jgi:hypothetical protein
VLEGWLPHQHPMVTLDYASRDSVVFHVYLL